MDATQLIYWSEFMEIVDNAQKRVLTENNVDVCFQLYHSTNILAHADGYEDAPRTFKIKMSDALPLCIYHEVVENHIFSQPLIVLEDMLGVYEERAYLEKIICLSTWTLAYFHEFSHVIQGHLALGIEKKMFPERKIADGIGAGSSVIGREDPELAKIYSLMEYDADIAAGRNAGPLAKYMDLKCYNQADGPVAGQMLMSLAVFYLIQLLNKDPQDLTLYPPNSIRVNSMMSSLHTSAQYFINNNKIIDHPYEINHFLLFSNEHWMKIIEEAQKSLAGLGCKMIDFDRERMELWLSMKAKNEHHLMTIHQNQLNLLKEWRSYGQQMRCAPSSAST